MRPARAIVLGGLTVAVLDGLDAVLFFGLRGVGADRIFRGIAAGLVGRDVAAEWGMLAVALGVVLHVAIATTIVAVAVLAARRWRTLAARPFLTGPLYGIGAWLVMNMIVMPLSATGRGPFAIPVVINGLLIHIFGVGIPAMLFARATRPREVLP